jgi:hypothetical protein
MKDILIGGVIIAVVIILLRVMFNTPLMREAFANSEPAIRSQTECPRGAKMYMHDGAAYCCSGTVNADAVRAKDSCRPLNSRNDSGITFCTLGPTKDGVRNCRGMRAELLDKEGAAICPPDLPTFVRNGQQARCCSSTGANADRTDCNNFNFCNSVNDPNPLKDQYSCQFMKMRSEDVQCPREFSQFKYNTDGMTLYGCVNMKGLSCYPNRLIRHLQSVGIDVSTMKPCSIYH